MGQPLLLRRKAWPAVWASPSSPGGCRTIHLAIDGVDAIDPDFYSIKGGGGALFREKIIACKARRVIWIMDQSKLVHSLSGRVLPVEVPAFAVPYVEEQVREAGVYTEAEDKRQDCICHRQRQPYPGSDRRR